MNRFKNYLSTEIAIEYKACLYFYAILFFYCLYCIAEGSFSANIIIMAEMIATAYIMGYIQVYLLRNFDEGEKLGIFECMAILLCAVLYSGISYLFHWFERNRAVTIGYFFYTVFLYVCMFWVNKIKRDIDTKQLNEELEEFKKKKNTEDERERKSVYGKGN